MPALPPPPGPGAFWGAGAATRWPMSAASPDPGLFCSVLGWLQLPRPHRAPGTHTLHRISAQFLSSPCVFLTYPSEFDGDKVFGIWASFSLQMNISTLFLIRQECASLPSPPPYPHPLPSKLPSLCNLDRKPCRMFDQLRGISSAFPGVISWLQPGPVHPSTRQDEGWG